MTEPGAPRPTLDDIEKTPLPPAPTGQSDEPTREYTPEGMDDRQLDIELRTKYSAYLFWLVVGWLGAVMAVMLAQGFAYGMFKLADSVLIALLGTTTVNVLGLFVIVARYIFPRRDVLRSPPPY